MRILLADHHPQPLWALRTTLRENSTIEVIGEALQADELLTLAAAHQPDLVLIDWELPGKPIGDLISELHERVPKPIVVVMGSLPEHGRMLLRAGADAFVSKSDQPEWLLEVLTKYERKTKKKVKD